MLSNRVKEYIAEHSFCSEYLFKDWVTFLEVLYSEGGRVSAILWWDQSSVLSQNFTLSCGYGTQDNVNSNRNMYQRWTSIWKDLIGR